MVFDSTFSPQTEPKSGVLKIEYKQDMVTLTAPPSAEKEGLENESQQKREPLKLTVITKVKANAVKQEYEKQDELKRSVWARPHPLPNLAPPHVASFERYMSILKSTYADQFAALPKSSKMYELLGSNLLFDKMAGNGKQSVEISKNILSLRFT